MPLGHTIPKSRLKILMSWVVALLCVVGLTAAPVAAQIASSALAPQEAFSTSIQTEGNADGRISVVKVETDADASSSGEDGGDPCDTDDVEDSAEHAVARVVRYEGMSCPWVSDAPEPPELVELWFSSHRALSGGARAPPVC